MNGTNFPDPSIIQVNSTWYSFATTTGGKVHIQVASSPDFNNWTLKEGYDALPNLPSWVDQAHPNTWAPDVNQLDDGSFVMYYTASTANESNIHCTAAATASSVEGPYTPMGDEPWECSLDMGGAIDPSGFRDTDGTRYVSFKIDGNSVGNGGSCNNGVAPIIPTPIMLQKVQSDGVTKVGPAFTILMNEPSDGPLVEAPSLIRSAGGNYTLFYSSNCFSSTAYDVAYATSPNITGPYTRAGSLFTSRSGMVSPGSADIDADGTHLLFHANADNGRALYTATINIADNKVTA
ncbi:MAG: hypothetical protein M1821_003242 [Bathelium mastoideum]|nr:MAG: hypothetical protein M1821_003242 [Bathelium mastoideum]KAI9689404.1 MAG: hypothetical protein M1822_010055 [Bathelium mastoideum]